MICEGSLVAERELPAQGGGSIPTPSLQYRPIAYREAARFIKEHHRHLEAPQGLKFAIGLFADGSLVGVATAGRPVARMERESEWCLEVTRVAVNGMPNANSILYAVMFRIARAMGYRRVITKTLPEETGASLRAAGWKLLGETGGGSWNRSSRQRTDKHPTCKKLRWERCVTKRESAK